MRSAARAKITKTYIDVYRVQYRWIPEVEEKLCWGGG